MGIVELLFSYKPLYDIFALVSIGLFFNEDINYSKINKKWI